MSLREKIQTEGRLKLLRYEKDNEFDKLYD